MGLRKLVDRKTKVEDYVQSSRSIKSGKESVSIAEDISLKLSQYCRFRVDGQKYRAAISADEGMVDIMIDMFGVPAWVTSVLLGLLIMSVIFAIWRLIRIGD